MRQSGIVGRFHCRPRRLLLGKIRIYIYPCKIRNLLSKDKKPQQLMAQLDILKQVPVNQSWPSGLRCYSHLREPGQIFCSLFLPFEALGSSLLASKSLVCLRLCAHCIVCKQAGPWREQATAWPDRKEWRNSALFNSRVGKQTIALSFTPFCTKHPRWLTARKQAKSILYMKIP